MPLSAPALRFTLANAVMISEAPSEILNKMCVILLRDSIENTRMKKKIDGFKELLESRGIKTFGDNGKGKRKTSENNVHNLLGRLR